MPQMTTTTKLEKAMAPLSTFAPRIPWIGRIWRLPFMGSQRIDTNVALHSLCTLSLRREMANPPSILF